MDSSANKALLIGVGLFVIIMITSAVLFLLGKMQTIYSQVYETDISIQGQFDEYESYDQTLKTGIEVKNAIKKYIGNPYVTVQIKEDIIVERGVLYGVYASSTNLNEDIENKVSKVIFGVEGKEIGEGLMKSIIIKDTDFVTIKFYKTTDVIY